MVTNVASWICHAKYLLYRLLTLSAGFCIVVQPTKRTSVKLERSTLSYEGSGLDLLPPPCQKTFKGYLLGEPNIPRVGSSDSPNLNARCYDLPKPLKDVNWMRLDWCAKDSVTNFAMDSQRPYRASCHQEYRLSSQRMSCCSSQSRPHPNVRACSRRESRCRLGSHARGFSTPR